MKHDDLKTQLRRRLIQTVGLTREQSEQILQEIFDVLDETPDEFIASRHLALQRQGWTNQEIYERLQEELDQGRFRAPSYSLRQIRRRIYD